MKSKNAWLRRQSEEPLRRIDGRYGDAGGMESALEAHVLAAEGRARRGVALSPSAPAVQLAWAALTTLLDDISAYGALGEMGNADQRVCDSLQPLLTRLTKTALLSGFTAAEEGEEREDGGGPERCPPLPALLLLDTDALVDSTARAISNCSPGVSRRAADCVFEAQLPGAAAADGGCALCCPTGDNDTDINHINDSPNAHHIVNNAAAAADPLSVCFGFADYSSSETGAMLWAGAVGLSLYLLERGHQYLWGCQQQSQPGCGGGGGLAIMEMGCGPALVSLVVADLLSRHGPRGQGQPVRLDVTDLAAGVVAEVWRSFAQRNDFSRPGFTYTVNGGPTVGGDGAQDTAALSPPSLVVNSFCLDFSRVDEDPALVGAYDVVLASDVVYDFTIARFVAPALEALLRPGGVAILCCEAHRDGMAAFTAAIRGDAASRLEVVEEEPDVRRLLRVLELPEGLTVSQCTIIGLRKRGGTGEVA